MNDKVHEEITKIDNDPQYIDFFKEKISQKWANEECKKVLQDVIVYYKEKKNNELYGNLSLLKQHLHLVHGELSDAIIEGELLVEEWKKQKQIDFLLKSYNALFAAYMYMGECRKAVSCGTKAFALAKSEDFHNIHIKMLLNAARLYILMHEFKRAEGILANAVHMSFFFKDEDKMFMAMNLAAIQVQKGDIDEAVNNCQQAYEIAEKLGRATGESDDFCFVLALRGYTFLARELISQAEKDFNEAIEKAKTKDYKIASVLNLLGLGLCYVEQQKYEEAIKQLLKAEHIAEETKSCYLQSIVQSKLFIVYEKTQQWEKAVKAMKKGEVYEKSIYRDKSSLWIDQLDTKNLAMQLERYKKLYGQMEQVAKIGASFTSQLSADHIQKVIYDEISKLLQLDFIGIAYIKKGETEYRVFDGQGKWVEDENDLVRYTQRLAQYCIERQQDIFVNDGNFEEYSLKTIKESKSKTKLQSMIVNVLKVDEQVIGAITVGSYKANSYSENDLNSAKIIASYLAISLKNSFLYQRVCYLADHDSLTGLLTRGVTLKKGEELFKSNHKKNKATAIIMFDTDNFKQINDKYGHQLGDTVLRRIGEIMRNAARKCDYVGRYGGEEFIAILDSVGEDEVIKIAERIKKQLENSRFECKREKDIKVTLSGGIYICNEYTLNFADAIRFADHALYRAKLLGRNRIISYNLIP